MQYNLFVFWSIRSVPFSLLASILFYLKVRIHQFLTVSTVQNLYKFLASRKISACSAPHTCYEYVGFVAQLFVHYWTQFCCIWKKMYAWFLLKRSVLLGSKDNCYSFPRPQTPLNSIRQHNTSRMYSTYIVQLDLR